ncbi:J domain-containing protein [Albimonas sp. CAU 1670]|uniref:J domain-containing protein n=1 Tax=Albimonas sp. CAU 1670 TaxID=3032599 RepID=UPI0023DC799B|nr:J domain-containing protein [Albimonas sp. CAU 1670]MDF2231821.1 J domain-containing protein [Albimonas sp. CAU 1670]
MHDHGAPPDPYQVLGVAKTATEKEIRAAWRKLAKATHPDLNPGDAEAEARFKRIGAAWDILGDPQTRARFDRGEIDGAGAETPREEYWRHHAGGPGGERYDASGGYDDFADMSEVFAEMFRRRGQQAGGQGPHGGPYGGPHGEGRARSGPRMRGGDLRLALEVEFLDAVYGATRRLRLPDGQAFEVTIPAGVREGEVVHLPGQGLPGFNGGPNGDALVEVSIRPHPVFSRDGDDILLELPITLDEAVLGAKVEVPTVTGKVTMTLPAGTSSGKTLRLRGKGVKPAGRPAGDQKVSVKIVMPETIDPELAEFMGRWKASHAYDPRAELRRRT